MILNFDESGNFGRQGRYFVIACVGGENMKSLENAMKKAVLNTKKQFPIYKNKREIKASEANPVIKDYFLRRIASKELDIRYVVADLHHCKQKLLNDENILYNFLLHFLIVPVAKKSEVKELTLNLDKRTIKVQSGNSFEHYIKGKLILELDLDIDIHVNYIESHNYYPIQAADFIANAVYAKYERGCIDYYNLIKHKIVQEECFPYRLFGTKKVVNLNP